MAHRTTGTIEIAAPPEAVFPWLTDPQKLPQWTGMDSAGLLPGNSADLHGGYRSRATFAAPDGPRDLDFEVTVYDPPREFTYRETHRGGESVASYRLSESGSGTLLEVDATTDSAASAGVPEEAERQLEQLNDELAKLKRCVEGE